MRSVGWVSAVRCRKGPVGGGSRGLGPRPIGRLVLERRGLVRVHAPAGGQDRLYGRARPLPGRVGCPLPVLADGGTQLAGAPVLFQFTIPRPRVVGGVTDLRIDGRRASSRGLQETSATSADPLRLDGAGSHAATPSVAATP